MPTHAAGDYLRCETATIGDDPQRDVLVLVDRDGKLDVCFMPDPADFSMLVTVDSDVRDVALLRGAGATGLDVILVLRDDGLHWYESTAGSKKPSERLDRLDDTWSSVDRIWIGADGGGTDWLFGTSSAAAEVRRARWDGEAWVDGVGFTAVPGATQMLTLDWDGVGDHEVVMRFGDQVYVLTWAGVPFWFFQFPTTPAGGHSLLGVMPAGGNEPDLLASFGWLPAVPGGPASSYVLLVQRAGIAQIVNFGLTAAASMAAADMDGDGRVDLLLGDAAHSVVHRLRRLAMADGSAIEPVQANGHYALVEGTYRPDGAVDVLAAADFDGDGDGDLIGLQSANRLHHFAATDVAPAQRLAAIAASADPQQAVTTMDATGYVLHLPLAIQPPEDSLGLLAQGEVMQVQVRAWLQPTPSSLVQTVACVPDLRAAVLGDAAVAAVVDVTAASLDPSSWSLWIHARLIAVGPSGSRLLPSRLFYFSPDVEQNEGRSQAISYDLTGEPIGIDGGDGNVTDGGDLDREPDEPPVASGPPGP